MENNGWKIKLCLFLFGVLIVGGYILTKVTEPKDENANEEKTKEVAKDIRLDNSKEYIYFENSETIEDELDIVYTTVVLNFNDTNNIASTLNNESVELKKELKYDAKDEEESKEEEDDKEEDAEVDNKAYNNLSFAHYKKYDVYSFDKYVSLVVNYYTYTPSELVKYEKTKAYVFDKNTGQLLTANDLLKDYNLKENDVNKKVQTYIDDQNVLKEDEHLDAKETLNLMDINTIYVDKLGNLSISVLVKSDKNDYNEVIILD